MLERLGRWLIAHRRLVVFASIAFAVFSAVFGVTAIERLSTSGFTDASAQSTKAESLLADRFNVGESNFVLVATTGSGGVDSASAASDGLALTRRLQAEAGVTGVASYWTTNASSMRSSDGSKALVIAHITGSGDQVDKRANTLTPAYQGRSGGLTVQVGGSAAVDNEANTQTTNDLVVAEAISFPITLILLILVFRGVVAAMLPLILGGFSVVGTFLVLRIIVSFTSVSVFALNLTTGLGLSLAIDYSLFMVTRYREELHAGNDPNAALVATMRTAGKTVAFSALTVSLALAAMLVFPLDVLRSFAYAGVAVVLLTVLGALVVLPALLAMLGTRVDKLAIWKAKPVVPQTGTWYRLANSVMRRPVTVGATVLVALIALGAPFMSVHFGLSDDRVLPPSAAAHVTADVIRSDFDSQAQSALDVVAPTGDASAVGSYATALSQIPGVVRVDAATGSDANGRQVSAATPESQQFLNPKGGAGTWLSVVPAVEPYSAAGEHLTNQVRAVQAPFQVLVGGPSADLVDTEQAISGRMWIAVAWIALTMLVLLFLFTGSVLLPLQAIVLSLVSLTAMFGAMVFVFQQGHLRWLVGDFVSSGTLDTTMPILMFCVAFGLSMDYQVFLLSRMKEEHDLTGDNKRAVAMGLQRTGPVITAAAGIVAVVFSLIGTSSISFIKMFGVGLALAVVVDSTIVRGLLVPAVMRLGGEANWWAPGLLRRAYDKIGLSEESGVAPERDPLPTSK
jgi:RND superfamily putative drug exporter